MELITQLGINYTAVYQFLIFFVAFMAMQLWIFQPYMAALEERDRRTLGGEELATEIQKETEDLHARYEARARELNDKIKTIFETNRTTAEKQASETLGKARAKAAEIIEKSRSELRAQVQLVESELKEEVSPLSVAVTQKLLSPEQ